MPLNTTQRHKRRLKLGLLIKVVVSIALFYGLYHQLFVRNDIIFLWYSLKAQLRVAPVWMVLAIVFLIPLNLTLEAIKFRLLLPQKIRPSVLGALRRVCAGISVGLFTPNRVGEYVGRLTGTSTAERVATIAATFLGGIAQLIPLLGGGVVCLTVYSFYGELEFASTFTTLVAILICIGLLLFFAFLPAAISLCERLWSSFRQNLSPGARIHRILVQVAYSLRGIRQLATERPGDVRMALVIAFSRYLIYLTQLSLAFVFFGLNGGLEIAFIGSGILLFAQTFVPLPSFVQALARVELALLVFAVYQPNELGLASASFLIFVLNLGIPALLGLVEILRSDLDKTLGINA